MDISFRSVNLLQPDPCPLHTDLIRNAPGNLFQQAKESWERQREVEKSLSEN